MPGRRMEGKTALRGSGSMGIAPRVIGQTSREELGGTPGELAFGQGHDRQDRGGSDLRPDTPGDGWQGDGHRAPLLPGVRADDRAEPGRTRTGLCQESVGETLGDGEDPPVQEEGRHPEGESRIRRGRVPEGGGVGGEEAIMSATRAQSSPGPAEKPGPGSDDAKRELERRLQADRDDREGGDSPVVNETSPQTPVRSEVTARASRGSSQIAILTRGWGTGLAWSLRAFLVMAVLGQAVAFAVNLARAPGESAAPAAKLGD